MSVGNDSDSYRYAIYIYNPDGSINREILYQSVGSLSHNFSYNSQGRLDGIGPQGGFGFHESIEYSYSGNITTTGMALAQQGPDTLEGVIYNYRTNYTYDDLGQLTGAVHNDNALTDLTMTYDPNGNILTQNNRTYNYISGTNKVKNTDGSGNDYTYNANGNITRANPKNIQQIRYDPFTQMTRRILTSRNITFQYDGSNRRVFRNHRVRVYPPGGEDDATDNPVMKQKYQKGPSEEAVIKDQYSGFSPAQVESKMMGAITWIYNNKLYLHGENAYPLVEYITSTNESETKQVYIYGATGLIATHRDSTTYTIIKDHLGSTRLVLDEDWAVVSWYDYAPFGNITRSGTGTKLNYRYTGQERDGATGLMNYRARMYDPGLGRFYAVDPAGQFASPYLYAANNPLSFTDPDGEWVWIIGAIIGAYTGGALANNDFDPTKWDFSSSKTWGYMLGGALVGGFSGYIGGVVAQSGVPMANTLGITSASLTNSIGTHIYTGGQTDISVSLGVASYNFNSGEWGYLGKEGNSTVENIGYGLGAIANVSDVLAGFEPGEVQLNTEHSDPIGHSAITDVGETDPYNSIVSVGPDPGGKWIFNPFKFKKGTNDWSNYVNAGDDVWKMTVKGVNVSRLKAYGAILDKNVEYNLFFSSCVNHTARALTISGVPVIGIHPFILHSQVYLRSIGFRPSMYSYVLTQ